ncbi:hypothetical protein [Rhodoblastus sp.]|uniref:hypothetical protein n=1 Tax=Rhodoblastus sp. TaxID=1962975 RepID=UPI003F95396E
MAKPIFAPARYFLLLAGLLILLLAGASGARAQSCNEDLAVFGKKRNTEIEALNAISKSHGGKLDPVGACPHFRAMGAIESQMLAYLTKNKEWCNIPDDFINGFKANTEKTAGISKQACELAEKVKKMQSQGGGLAGGGNLPPPPKLPAGPL